MSNIRIRVLGGSGSGKSYLAKKLASKYQLPVLHLDDIYWKPGWEESSWHRVRKIVSRFINDHESWIIDGNYSSIKDLTLPPATHVIMRRPVLYKHLWRLFWREVVRRSSYKFLPVTRSPLNNDSREVPFYEVFQELLPHAIRYYKYKSRQLVEECRKNFPHIKIYIHT